MLRSAARNLVAIPPVVVGGGLTAQAVMAIQAFRPHFYKHLHAVRSSATPLPHLCVGYGFPFTFKARLVAHPALRPSIDTPTSGDALTAMLALLEGQHALTGHDPVPVK